jgi:hypothetical protein
MSKIQNFLAIPQMKVITYVKKTTYYNDMNGCSANRERMYGSKKEIQLGLVFI